MSMGFVSRICTRIYTGEKFKNCSRKMSYRMIWDRHNRPRNNKSVKNVDASQVYYYSLAADREITMAPPQYQINISII